ncbi:MAG: glycosyltransferase family 2 protein [Candidatus Omnitrophica bacterium]|nr:glycosyltransferase family 2 protein [Candidatus Omnitrophota bacterium]
MNIVIPLAGKDARFEQMNIAKPLIEVEGKPLVKFCIDTLEYPFKTHKYKLYFLILKEHDEKYNLKNKLKGLYPQALVIIIEKLTEGTACTVLTLENEINNDEELIVYLADIYFRADLKAGIESGRMSNTAGFIPVFKSDNRKYSYAKIGPEGKVGEVAEKKVISENASSGFYYFRKGKYFVDAAKKMINNGDRVNGLFFLCPVYNYLIRAGLEVRTIDAEFIFDLVF